MRASFFSFLAVSLFVGAALAGCVTTNPPSRDGAANATGGGGAGNTSAGSPLPACSNLADDDGDGKTDAADPGCEGAADSDERDPAPLAACANLRDDDGDGRTDFPADPGCLAATDGDEADATVLAACANQADDDGDGKTDFPADPGCASLADGDEADAILKRCADGLDNDGDGKIDAADVGCTSPSDDDETNPLAKRCADGLDNDNDGKIDMADPGCTGSTDDDETNPLAKRCADGLDNDNDGKIDMADPGCTSSSDDDEANAPPPQCGDGIDNDRDGKVDMADPGCTSNGDVDEADGAGPGPGQNQNQTQNQGDPNDRIRVTATGGSYTAWNGTRGSGFLTTGQAADIALSSFGFNQSGGAGLFNHPGGIATDGTHLLVVDVRNNRVLVWNTLPTTNGTLPDLVLGQPDFTTTRQGSTLAQLNFPIGISTDGTRVFVADAENDRILVWSTFPTRSGQPADFAISRSPEGSSGALRNLVWPWAVWTDGTKLVATSTHGSKVFVWNTLPTSGTTEPSFTLTARSPTDGTSQFGTPRSIGSDGTYLMIGDHNARANGGNPGNYFWSTFPTSDVAYDFMMINPQPIQPGQVVTAFTFYGGMKAGDKFLMVGNHGLHIWNGLPTSANDIADVSLFGGGSGDFGPGWTGDAGGLAVAGTKLYVSLYNGNKIVMFRELPTAGGQRPQVVFGASSLDVNTLETNYLITNPQPASDGTSLFVVSEYERAMYVWRRIPDQSGAPPDYVYEWEQATQGLAIHGGRLVTAGGERIHIWNSLPLSGQQPDFHIKRQLGNLTLAEIKGVALDSSHFYLAMGDYVYVWNTLPTANQSYDFRLRVSAVSRISSDGTTLLAVSLGGGLGRTVLAWNVTGLNAETRARVATPAANGIGHAFVSGGRVFVADVGFNRVQIWNTVDAFAANAAPAVVIGAANLDEREPGIGAAEVFWPNSLWFDGTFLWVGEVKFSGRLLRYDVAGTT